MSLIEKLRKEKYEKQTFQISESNRVGIQNYIEFGQSMGINVDVNDLIGEAIKELLSGQKDYQMWLKNRKNKQ